MQIQSGNGYDLNVSLFERLVNSGIDYVPLQCLHRMRPEISKLVRTLTYPHLQDAADTQGREPLATRIP
jgi:hypothetical protein